jgi:hypothetical protein
VVTDRTVLRAGLPLARKASQKTGPRSEGNLSRLRHSKSARRATKDGGPRRKLVRAAIAAQESAAGCKSRKGSLAAAAAAGLEIISTTHVSATIRALGSPTIILVLLAELGDDSGIRDGDVGGTVVGPGSNKSVRIYEVLLGSGKEKKKKNILVVERSGKLVREALCIVLFDKVRNPKLDRSARGEKRLPLHNGPDRPVDLGEDRDVGVLSQTSHLSVCLKLHWQSKLDQRDSAESRILGKVMGAFA